MVDEVLILNETHTRECVWRHRSTALILDGGVADFPLVFDPYNSSQECSLVLAFALHRVSLPKSRREF